MKDVKRLANADFAIVAPLIATPIGRTSGGPFPAVSLPRTVWFFEAIFATLQFPELLDSFYRIDGACIQDDSIRGGAGKSR
jgi:hypothetical protein